MGREKEEMLAIFDTLTDLNQDKLILMAKSIQFTQRVAEPISPRQPNCVKEDEATPEPTCKRTDGI